MIDTLMDPDWNYDQKSDCTCVMITIMIKTSKLRLNHCDVEPEVRPTDRDCAR